MTASLFETVCCMSELRDLLLILHADHSGDAPEGYRETQRLSPRVVIVESHDDAAKEKLRTMNGVDLVLEPGENPPAEVRETLTDTEKLFVDAHAQRSRQKERPGEGLSWGSKGFLPPDPPLRR